jgi:hypothetical protein
MKWNKKNLSGLQGEDSGGGVGNNTGPKAGQAPDKKKRKGQDVGEEKLKPRGGAGAAGNAGNAGGLGGGETGGMEGSQLAGGFEGQGPPKANS